MGALKIISGILLLTGFGTVLGAKSLVKRFDLEAKTNINFENEMNESEAAEYKKIKAAVNVKIVGMLIALPGVLILLIAFR